MPTGNINNRLKIYFNYEEHNMFVNIPELHMYCSKKKILIGCIQIKFNIIVQYINLLIAILISVDRPLIIIIYLLRRHLDISKTIKSF